MKTARNLLLVAAFVTTAQMAAALTAQELATSLQSQGYSYIAIETGTTQLAVRAYKDGQSVRAVYDIATGALLATKSEPHAAPSGTDTGVRLGTEDRDFVAVAADGTVTPLGRDGAPRDGQRPEREDHHNGSDDTGTASQDATNTDDGHRGHDRAHDQAGSTSDDDSDEGNDDSAHAREDHGEGHGRGQGERGGNDHD